MEANGGKRAGVAVAAILVVPASRYVDGFVGSQSFWNRVITFLVLFLMTYVALKLVEYVSLKGCIYSSSITFLD